MSTLISLLFPTFIHLILLVSLLSLALLSIPTTSPSASQIYRLWAGFFMTICDLSKRYLLCLYKVGTSFCNKGLAQLKVLLSSALPEIEETCFEEQFKYMIVTSSVLNDISPQLPANPPFTNSSMSSNSATTTTNDNGGLDLHIQSTLFYVLIGTLSVSTAILFCFSIVNYIGAICFHWSHPSYISLFLVQAGFLGSIFMTYRKMRYAKIRGIYARLLRHLQRILKVTNTSDHLMDQLVDKIHEVETISQGHTLAPMNSALEQPRFHQSSQTNDMQSTAQSILTPYMEFVNTLLQQVMPLTRSINLSALRGMYNMKSVSVDSGYDDPAISIHSYERLDCLVYMIRSNRREWFMRLLALEMMTLGHDSARQDYEALLGIVDDMMVIMEQQTKSVVEKMADVLKSDLYNGPLNTMDDNYSDPQSQAVSTKLAILEKYVRNLQTKIVLCRQDARCMVTSLNKRNESSFNKINDRFGSMDQDILHILDQWDENKSYIHETINNEQQKSTPGSALPSPPSSPNSTISKRASLRRSYTIAINANMAKIASNSLSIAPQTTPVLLPVAPPLPSTTPPSMPLSHALPSDKDFQSQLSLLKSPPSPSTLPPAQSSQLEPLSFDSPIPHSSDAPSDERALAPIPLTDSKTYLLDVTTVDSSLSSRRSWITEASVASFIESRRAYKQQAEQVQQETATG